MEVHSVLSAAWLSKAAQEPHWVLVPLPCLCRSPFSEATKLLRQGSHQTLTPSRHWCVSCQVCHTCRAPSAVAGLGLQLALQRCLLC